MADQVDTDKPSAARVYDYYLGGEHHWAIDREFAQRAIETFPPLPALANANRRFALKAVHQAVRNGLTQFVDLGSGIPSMGSVHDETALLFDRRTTPHVVYVDNEPVAASHSRIKIQDDEADDWVGVAQVDMQQVDAVLTHPEMHRLIDFTQPVCLLMTAVLHFIPDGEVERMVARYRDALAPGSWVVVSHITDDQATVEDAELIERLRASYEHTQNPLYVRTEQQVRALLPGQLREPGLVGLPDWLVSSGSEDERTRPFAWCGVSVV